MAKPPMPTNPTQRFPRIDVDQSEDGAFSRVLTIGVRAADGWAIRGIHQHAYQRMAPADIARCQVREALLHLLELGVIDIDEERLDDLRHYPGWREAPRG